MEPSRSGNTDEENTGEDRGETYRQDRGKLLVKTERNLSSRPKETYRQDPGKLIVKIEGNLSSRSRETYRRTGRDSNAHGTTMLLLQDSIVSKIISKRQLSILASGKTLWKSSKAWTLPRQKTTAS